MANLNIKLVKSLNGRIAKHKATAEALGLRKIGPKTAGTGRSGELQNKGL